MAYGFTSWEGLIRSDELMHFGTKGMRWGQRRFQNEDGSLTALGRERYGKEGKRGAFGRSMDLNKLDRERVNAEYKAKKYRDKAESRFSRQQYRAKKKDPKAHVEKDEKTRKWEEKSSKYSKVAAGGKKMIDRIISDSTKKKMSVRSKETLRTVNAGSDLAKSFGVSALLGGYGLYTQSHHVVGNHYRVKNDGRGQRLHKKKNNVRKYAGRSSTTILSV